MPAEANVGIQFEAQGQQSTKADIERIQNELKRIGKLQDNIAERGIQMTDNYRLKSSQAVGAVQQSFQKLIDIQKELEKQGEKAPEALKESYNKALKSVIADLNKVDNLQSKLIKDHEKGIEDKRKAEEKAAKEREDEIERQRKAEEKAAKEAEAEAEKQRKEEEKAEKERLAALEKERKEQERADKEAEAAAEKLRKEEEKAEKERLDAIEKERKEQEKADKEAEAAIERQRKEEEAASKKAQSNIEKEEKAALRKWREEQRLFERHERDRERAHKRQMRRNEELLMIANQIGMEMSFLGRRGLDFSFRTIESARFFELLFERLKNIEGGAAAAQAQMDRFMEAVKLPGATFELLSEFATLLGQVGIKGEELVTFATDYANAATLYGLEARQTVLSLRQIIDTIRKGKIETDDFNSLMESGGFLAEHLQKALGDLAANAKNLNDQVGKGSENWKNFWLNSIGGSLAAETRADTDSLTVAQENLNAALLRASAAWGQEIAPIYKTVANVIEDLAIAFEGLPKAVRQILAVTTLVGSAGLSLVGTLTEVVTSVGITVLALKATGVSLAAVTGSVLAALGPIALYATAAIALGTAIYKLNEISSRTYSVMNPVVDIVTDQEKAWKTLNEAVDEHGHILTNPSDGVIQAVDDLGPAISVSAGEMDKLRGTVERTGNGLVLFGADVDTVMDSLKNFTLLLVEADDKVSRTQTRFRAAEGIKELRNIGAELKTALEEVANIEVEEIDAELNVLGEGEIDERQELVARRRAVLLKLERDKEAVDQRISNAEKKLNQEKIADEKKVQKEITDAVKQGAQFELDQAAKEQQQNTKDLNDKIAFRKQMEAESVQSTKDFAQQRLDAAAAESAENEAILFRNRDAILQLEEEKRQAAEKTGEDELSAAIKSKDNIDIVLHDLIWLYEENYAKRIELVEKSNLTEREKELEIWRLQQELAAKREELHDRVYDSEKVHLEDIKLLVEQITARMEQWRTSTEEVGESAGLSWQQYTQYGLEALSVVNDILEANDRLEDQLDRIEKRTEKSIFRIKQRALDQGRPLTLQEQRRIQELEEDADESRERARDDRADSLLSTGFTAVGTAVGIGVGFYLGGPAGAGIGASIGSQAGRETGRLVGNLFHEPQQDRFASYAGANVAKMTSAQITQRNAKNAADFSEYFSNDFGKVLGEKVAEKLPMGNGNVTVNLNATLKLDSGSTNLIVEDIITAQGNESAPKWPNRSLAGV